MTFYVHLVKIKPLTDIEDYQVVELDASWSDEEEDTYDYPPDTSRFLSMNKFVAFTLYAVFMVGATAWALSYSEPKLTRTIFLAPA